MSILQSRKEKTLNKRTELSAKCRHKNKFSARNFKRVQNDCNLKCKRKLHDGVTTQKSTDERCNCYE